MNTKQYRAAGYATIFRHGHVYLIHRDTPTEARVHPVDRGRWMEYSIDEMWRLVLADLPAPSRDDIRATLAACYCDQCVDLCDYCGDIRPALQQPALPGAEIVREIENPTPAYDAPFSLTPKPAPAIPPRAMRLFNNDHED